jgi:protein-S-isoprenylcysteine O-methyltransferase Ste14
MPLHSYFVLVAFIMLGVVLILQVAGLKRDGSEFIGKPSIDRYYFYSGKIAIFTTWGLFILKAVIPKLGYINFPVHVSWIATGILWAGAVAVALALVSLGRSLKVGLPDMETTLKTKGIYSMSRNPLYTGIYLISIASCLYFPDLISFSFLLYGIYIHHQIIRREENFLAGRFGSSWDEYSSRVRRYI